MDEKILIELVNKNYSIRDISIELDVSFSTVRYWLNKHKLKTKGLTNQGKWTKEKLINAVNKSDCKSDVLRELNIKLNSGNFQTLDKKLREFGIDDSKLVYDYSRGNKWKPKIGDHEIFKENSTYRSGALKRKIIKNGLIPYKCQKCGIINEWLGEEIVLHLDHINGINNDNRIDNLRFLCPNCHSQTSTYCRK